MPAQPQLLIAMAVYTALLLLIFRLPVFAFLDKTEEGRDAHLDGLRFFLAIAVVYHHFLISYRFFHNLEWTFIFDKNPVLFRFGRYGVAGFFMLSAYLFADRKFKSARSYLTFYLKRLLRVTPLAYLVTFLYIVIAFALNYEIGSEQTFRRLSFWSEILISPFMPYYNALWLGLNVTCGVMWTLSFEWLLYLAVPLISVARNLVAPMLMEIVTSIAMIIAMQKGWMDGNLRFLLCFSLGMLARDLRGKIKISALKSDFLVVLSVLLLFLLKTDPASALNISLLFVAFFLVINGSTIFGLLSAKSSVRLGQVSYSIYLLHGMFFFNFNWFTMPLHLSPTLNLVSLFGLVCLICYLSTLSFRYIELPFMRLGDRIRAQAQSQRKS